MNQYTSVGGASHSYDGRGNLTSTGAASYGYDIYNRLTGGPGSAALSYDPVGRLYETSASGVAATRFLYDGAALIAEYNTSGTMLRRYVHGPGVDEAIVWYEGAGTSDPRWLISDQLGSIVAVTNASGAATHINTYDEYGTPGSSNTGRFQYTGQAWLPEAALYHYKARVYSPAIGRFLQTDPIRYGDGMNIYAYVGSDPVNWTDPSGLSKPNDDPIIVTSRCEENPGCMALREAALRAELGSLPPPTAPQTGELGPTPIQDRPDRDRKRRQCDAWSRDEAEGESVMRAMAFPTLMGMLLFEEREGFEPPSTPDLAEERNRPGGRMRRIPGGPGVQAGVGYVVGPYGMIYGDARSAYVAGRTLARQARARRAATGC